MVVEDGVCVLHVERRDVRVCRVDIKVYSPTGVVVIARCLVECIN